MRVLLCLLLLISPVSAGIEDTLADLRSDDEDAALAAALALDPHVLTLAELRRQAEVLSRHPDRLFRKRPPRQNCPFLPADALGAVDLPRIFDAATRMKLEPDSRIFFELHRALLPEQLPALARSMARARPPVRGHLIRLFDTAIRSMDASGETALRGLLWELALEEASAAGKPPPELNEVVVDLPEVGLPPGFKALVESAWQVGEERRYLQNWLRRYSRRVTPKPEDLDFLALCVDWPEFLPNRAAFVRLVGRIESSEARALLQTLSARKDDELAAFAAAELARDGESGLLCALLDKKPPPEEGWMIAFEVLPEIAIELWLRAFREGDPDRPPLRLDPEMRDEMESLFGVRIESDILDRLAEGILDGPAASLTGIVDFFSWVHPDALTGPVLDEIVNRLLLIDTFTAEEFFPERFHRLFGYLEVRAPKRLAKVLCAFQEGMTGEQYAEFTAEVPLFWFPVDESSLAARARAAGQPREIIEALIQAEMAGVPESALAVMRTRAEEEDWAGAAIRFVEACPENAASLVRIDDPRVLPLLRRLRDERRARWAIVGALARLGDEAAREEWLGLVQDGRMWILYKLPEALATLGGDPEFVILWIERIEGTCCVSCHAQYTLSEIFPTLDFDDVPASYPILRRRAAAFFERHKGSFGWSRILRGFVPVR